MTTKKAVLLLGILVCFVYVPFLGNAFVSDDIQGIVESLPALNWVTSLGWPRAVHLSTLFQYITYLVFGLQPWVFRLVNILFHIGSVWLVYLIGRRLVTPVAALVAALLFAVHPLATESVTWISGGIYVQYACWFLLSFWCYIQGKKHYWLSLLFFTLSVCTSEKALSLFLLFVVYEWFYGHWKKHVISLIPFFLVNISLIVFYGSQVGVRTQQLAAASYQSFAGFMNSFVQIPVAISSYLQLFVFPVGLTLYHSELSFPWWNFAVRSGVTLVFIGIGVYAFVKRKAWGMWIWWFVIGLLVTLTPFKVGWVVAERYVYLSLAGLCVAIGIGFDIVMHKKKLFISSLCVGILVILGLCTLTVFRNSQWRTEDTLWIATARTSPSHPPTWNNMGDVYARAGDLEQAAVMFQRAIALNPQYADAYHNLGHTYLRMGELGKAKEAYQKALAINPNLWQSYRDLAAILASEGNLEAAQTALNQALTIMPEDETLLQLQLLIKK